MIKLTAWKKTEKYKKVEKRRKNSHENTFAVTKIEGLRALVQRPRPIATDIFQFLSNLTGNRSLANVNILVRSIT